MKNTTQKKKATDGSDLTNPLVGILSRQNSFDSGRTNSTFTQQQLPPTWGSTFTQLFHHFLSGPDFGKDSLTSVAGYCRILARVVPLAIKVGVLVLFCGLLACGLPPWLVVHIFTTIFALILTFAACGLMFHEDSRHARSLIWFAVFCISWWFVGSGLPLSLVIILSPFIEEFGIQICSPSRSAQRWLRVVAGSIEVFTDPVPGRAVCFFGVWLLPSMMKPDCPRLTWHFVLTHFINNVLVLYGSGSFGAFASLDLVPMFFVYAVFWMCLYFAIFLRLQAFTSEIRQLMQYELRRTRKHLKRHWKVEDGLPLTRSPEAPFWPQSGSGTLSDSTICNMLESCAIALGQLRLCRTKKDYLLVFCGLWKMLFPGEPLSQQFYDACARCVGTFDISDLTSFDPFTPQADFGDFLDAAKKVTSRAKDMRPEVSESNVMYVLRFLLCKGILKNIGIDFDILGFDKFEERSFRKKHSDWDSTKLMDYVVDLIRYGWKYFKYGENDVELLIGGDKFASFYDRYTTIIDDDKRNMMNAFDQLVEIKELIDMAAKLGKREPIYVRFHEKLLDLLMKVQSWQRNQRSRDPPFTILLTSPPECGKTDLCYKLFRLHSSVDPMANWSGENNVFSPNSAMKYWDNFVGQIYFLFDDIGCFRKDSKVVDELLTLLIQVVNTVSMVPEKSDVTEKGKYACEPKMLIATSNIKDAGASTTFRTVEAVMRRFNLHVEVTPKRELCYPDTLKLRNDLTPEQQLSPWNLSVQRYEIKSSGDGWGGHHVPVKEYPQPDGSVFTTEDSVPYEKATFFIAQEIKQHIAKNQQRKERVEGLLDGDFYCEHHCLTTSCPVCSAPFEPQMGMLALPWYLTFTFLSWTVAFLVVLATLSPFICVVFAWCFRAQLYDLCDHLGFIPATKDVGPKFVSALLLTLGSRSSNVSKFGFVRRQLLLWSYRFTAWYDHTLVPWREYGELVAAKTFKLTRRHKFLLGLIAGYAIMRVLRSPSYAPFAPQGGEFSAPVSGDEKENPWRSNDMVPDVPFLTQATQTTTLENLTESIRKYTLVLTCGTASVFATPLGGQWFAVPTHFLDVGTDYQYRQLGNNHLTFSHSFQLTENDRRDVVGRDISLIRIRSARNVRDFTKFFPLRPTSFSSSKCFRTSSVGREFELVGGKSYRSITSMIFDSVLYGKGSMEKVALYTGDAQAGDCGAPVLLTTNGVFVGGVHIGHNGKYAMAALVTQEDFEGLDFGPCDAELDLGSSNHVKILSSTIHHKSVFRYLPEGCVKVFGSFQGFRRGARSYVGPAIGASIAAKYNIFPEFGPPVMKGYAPWRKNMMAAVKPVSLDMHKLRLCVENFCEKLRDLPPEVTKLLHKIPLDVAVNGYAGAKFIDSMNLKSSAGFPYNKSKSHFVVRDPDPPQYAPDASLLTPEIERDVDRIMQCYAEGKMANPVFVGSLKDEPRTFEKIEEGNTRVFAGAPFGWCLVVRMYLLTFTRVFQTHHFLFENAVGIDVTSKEWGELREYFLRNQMRIFDGDYKKFDKKMVNYLVTAAFDVMKYVCAQSPDFESDDLAVIDCIAADAANCTMDYNGDLIQMISTNPSGNPLTVVINCIVNSLLQRYAFLCENGSLDDFNENVQPINYGDDNITGVKDGVNFNHLIMAKHMEKVGMGYTMADKGAEPKAFTPIDELEFLKRRFVVRDGWTYAPLDVKSIHRMLTVSVYSRKVDRYEQAANALRSVLFESYQHGKAKFDFYRAIVLEIIMHHNMMPYFETTGIYDFDYFERRRLDSVKLAQDACQDNRKETSN